jgi:hypothetical protein
MAEDAPPGVPSCANTVEGSGTAWSLIVSNTSIATTGPAMPSGSQGTAMARQVGVPAVPDAALVDQVQLPWRDNPETGLLSVGEEGVCGVAICGDDILPRSEHLTRLHNRQV